MHKNDTEEENTTDNDHLYLQQRRPLSPKEKPNKSKNQIMTY